MPDIRKRGFDTFVETGLEPILITPENLHDWVVRDHPIHAAYEFLSYTGRGDYLQAYLMYHHGGGYADIKPQTSSWLPSVRRVLSSKYLMGSGYREIRGSMPWLQNSVIDGKVYILSRSVPRIAARIATDTMRVLWPFMIGNGACFFKPKTLYAKIWLGTVEKRMDLMLQKLQKNPATNPRDKQGDQSGYPLPWAFLCGEINSPLSLAFCWALDRSLPAPMFDNYR